MSNLVNLVKALLGLKFDVRSFKARKKGVRVRSQIDEHVRVRSIFDKMVFDPSLTFTVSEFLLLCLFAMVEMAVLELQESQN